MDPHVHIRDLTTEGFSNVHVSNVKTWGFFFSKHISLELDAPRISSRIGQYVVVGPNSTVHGNSSIQLEGLRTSIQATVNILTHNIKNFDASFHLNHASAQIVAEADNADYSQNVTTNVNNYLNFGFNQDYGLHKKLSEGLKQLLEVQQKRQAKMNTSIASLNVEAEKAIKDLIELLQKFDPIDIEEYSFDILEYDIRRNATIKGIHFEGFSEIVPNVSLNVDLSRKGFTLKISLPKVSASVKSWESDLHFLYGKGNARIDVEKLEMSMCVLWNTSAGSFSPSQVVTSIGRAEASITGINNDKNLSQAISGLLNYYLNSFLTSARLQKMLGTVLDNVMKNISTLIITKLFQATSL
ncbi:hypothetical protein FQR65_LT04598 [Abscondita terminalis]|nr:hypothetical protein FQR65_LT04598 [Abscondita terminalis]